MTVSSEIVSSELNVHGIGMCSALSDYYNSCAAYRVGFNRFTGSENFGHGVQGDDEATPIQISPLPNYLEGYQSIGRLVKMLQLAYRDLNTQFERESYKNNLNAYFSLPDITSLNYTFSDEELALDISLESKIKNDFSTRYVDLIAPALNANKLFFEFGGRISFLENLAKAMTDLNEGRAEYCLVFGVDCLLNNELIDSLLEQNTLKTAESPNGFIPGEGAIAILLSKTGSLPNKIDHLLKLTLSFGSEPVPTEQDWENEEKLIENEKIQSQSWQGSQLSEITTQCIQSIGMASGALNWFSDMNGDVFRATETGLFQVKMNKHMPTIDFPFIQTPVSSFGELGLISGGFYFALILFYMERGCLEFNYSLIALSEDSGKRAVMLLG